MYRSLKIDDFAKFYLRCRYFFSASLFYEISRLALSYGQDSETSTLSGSLSEKLTRGNQIILAHLKDIAEFVNVEYSTFSGQKANFRRVKDEGEEGYVTALACEDSIREVETDGAETSPTFSTNPILRESESVDSHKKAEFRPYFAENCHNLEAWEKTLGRKIFETSVSEVNSFMLSSEQSGVHSFQNRPHGAGNFIFGVEKLEEAVLPSDRLQEQLLIAKDGGASVGMILVYSGKAPDGLKDKLRLQFQPLLILEDIPQDPLGLVKTLVLKQVLHLISNGSMILMGKIFGNRMIDVRPSNNKLIDRCIRLVRAIWEEFQPNLPLDNGALYEKVAHVKVIKSAYHQLGVYTPSTVKIILAMFALKKDLGDFQLVVDYLMEKNEDIDWIKG